MEMRSNSKHIALDKTRATLNLLRKSNLRADFASGENQLMYQFVELQNILRHSSSEPVDPLEVLKPFLALLKSSQLSGPFKLSALNSIQVFLSSSVLSECPAKTGEALAEVVEAVTKCRFVQTDTVGDEAVQLRIVETLGYITRNPVRRFLSNQTAWDITEACYNILMHTGNSLTRSSTLYFAAETALVDCVKYVFSVNQLTRSFESGEEEEEGCVGDDRSNKESRWECCASRILRFFLGVINRRLPDSSGNFSLLGQSGALGSSNNNSNSNSSNSGNIPGAATPGKQRKLRGSIAISEISLDGENLELLLALKVIHACVLSEDCNLANARSQIIHNPVLTSLIRDELGKALVLLCSTRVYSSNVLQSALSLFATLFVSFGPALRVTVECFFRYVYLRGLLQLEQLLVKQLDLHACFAAEQTATPPSSSWPGTGDSSAGFDPSELETILESLTDLLTTPGMLPTLFASFDCDAASVDVVQALIRSLCTCTRAAMCLEAYAIPFVLQSLVDLVMQLHGQVLVSLAARHASAGGDFQQSAEELTDDVIGVTSELHYRRLSKLLLKQSVDLFVQKPEKGLRFLQENGALPTPLTASSVARFLRFASTLPKECCGSYLGELGKENPLFEGDGIEFHREVLENYVKCFNFTGQSVLVCMRIFLSAFRLPGEAQQIDRILIAFSEYCHANCLEGQNGLLENPEVTYLLTFSIIMLNTDRHNPNIRAERKMTMEQFVRNNLHYGPDLKQTRSIPREFLEGIYRSISECQIRTEKNDILADINPEIWMDMDLQAKLDIDRCCLVTNCHDPSLLQEISGSVMIPVDCRGSVMETEKQLQHQVLLTLVLCSPRSAAATTHSLLTGEPHRSPLQLSKDAKGCGTLVDRDMFECVWKDLLSVGLCPFVLPRQSPVVVASPRSNNPERRYLNVRIRGMQSAIDSLSFVTLAATKHNIAEIPHVVFALMASFAGVHKDSVATEIISKLRLDSYFRSASSQLQRHSRNNNNNLSAAVGTMTPPGTPGTSRRPSVSGAVRSIRNISDTDYFLETIINWSSARVALSTMFRFARLFPACLTVDSWKLIWHSLAVLRDCLLLPREMVVDNDVDLLPLSLRGEFEGILKSMEPKQTATSRVVEKRSPSILSLQGLGEALFGSSSSSAGDQELSLIPPDECGLSSRWDSGYEISENFPLVLSSNDRLPEEKVPSVTVTFAVEPLYNDIVVPSVALKVLSPEIAATISTINVIEETFSNLRDLVATSQVSSLVSESRFVSDLALQRYLQAMVAVLEAEDVAEDAFTDENENDVEANLLPPMQPLAPISPASTAWMEMVLVEVTLRNRDRFAVTWPTLCAHYKNTLGGCDRVSYVAERRISGLLKLAARLIGRESCVEPILSLLGTLFVPSGDGLSSANFFKRMSSPTQQLIGRYVKPAGTEDLAISSKLMNAFANQISAGMWSLLTLNVAALPSLRLEQWQVLFDVIAVGASAGGFASIKAFEALAWLLHEPRLHAEVPVFCIVGINPLLCNSKADVSVSIGAIQLLSHLHTRLEVLIKEDLQTDYVYVKDAEHDDEETDGDTPVLWESCWVPILRSLAAATTDERVAVRLVACDALGEAIRDRHASSVPSGVLINILGDIIVPTVLQLGRKAFFELESSSSLPPRSSSAPLSLSALERRVECENRDIGESHVTDNDNPAIRSLEHLCTCFSRQLRRIGRYPSFDKLWLRMLHLFGFYLALKAVLTEDDSALHESKIWMREKALGQLMDLLRLMVRSDIFEKREGLLEITSETVREFYGADEVNRVLQSSSNQSSSDSSGRGWVS